jgi:hypothetical protein
MHHANLSKSERLKAVARILADGREHSTMELARKTNQCAIHSSIAELRANGFDVSPAICRTINGRRVYFYRHEPKRI